MHELAFENDGVIGVYAPGRFKAEDVSEVESVTGAVNVLEAGRVGKALVMLVDIVFLQEAVGLVDGAYMFSAQCLDEPVLMGTVAALNPALGLGASGKEMFNAEPLQDTPHLGETNPLIVWSPHSSIAARRDVINAAIIGVKLPWNAETPDVGFQHRQDILSVLCRGEAEKDPAGGIIDRHQKAAGFSSSFEPIMMTAIELDEITDCISALALSSVRAGFTDIAQELVGLEPPGECLSRDIEAVF